MGIPEWVDTSFEGHRVTKLDINVKATAVKVCQATEEPVQVETNNEYITTWVDSGGTLSKWWRRAMGSLVAGRNSNT